MSQSLSKIYIHLVFATKGRADLLPLNHLGEIHAYIAETLNNNGCKAIAVGGTTNHVHILYVQSKSMSLSDTVRLVKSCSSKWINEHGSKFSLFGWQDGYGAFSISTPQYRITEEKKKKFVQLGKQTQQEILAQL